MILWVVVAACIDGYLPRDEHAAQCGTRYRRAALMSKQTQLTRRPQIATNIVIVQLPYPPHVIQRIATKQAHIAQTNTCPFRL